jgi:small subunit ribosomal protein S3
MTHVSHPYAHRLGVIRGWKSRWFAGTKKQYRSDLRSDTVIREFLKKRLRGMHTDILDIERDDKQIRIKIRSARPGMVIGRSGEGAQKLQKDLQKLVKDTNKEEKRAVKIDIEEIRTPESHAAIVAYMIAEGLEKRMQFRRVMKQTVEKVMANRDVLGVRLALSGRLGGAEMSRAEELRKGRVPLQTLRADIDFAREKAYLPYGVIGIKVWIYRGDIFSEKEKATTIQGVAQAEAKAKARPQVEDRRGPRRDRAPRQ